jgi:hypothetical protein
MGLREKLSASGSVPPIARQSYVKTDDGRPRH